MLEKSFFARMIDTCDNQLKQVLSAHIFVLYSSFQYPAYKSGNSDSQPAVLVPQGVLVLLLLYIE